MIALLLATPQGWLILATAAGLAWLVLCAAVDRYGPSDTVIVRPERTPPAAELEPWTGDSSDAAVRHAAAIAERDAAPATRPSARHRRTAA